MRYHDSLTTQLLIICAQAGDRDAAFQLLKVYTANPTPRGPGQRLSRALIQRWMISNRKSTHNSIS